jgi:hypothetical protein
MNGPVGPVLDRVSHLVATARRRRREHAEDEIPMRLERAAAAAPSGVSLRKSSISSAFISPIAAGCRRASAWSSLRAGWLDC